jgi:hypothetical protein
MRHVCVSVYLGNVVNYEERKQDLSLCSLQLYGGAREDSVTLELYWTGAHLYDPQQQEIPDLGFAQPVGQLKYIVAWLPHVFDEHKVGRPDIGHEFESKKPVSHFALGRTRANGDCRHSCVSPFILQGMFYKVGLRWIEFGQCKKIEVFVQEIKAETQRWPPAREFRSASEDKFVSAE